MEKCQQLGRGRISVLLNPSPGPAGLVKGHQTLPVALAAAPQPHSPQLITTAADASDQLISFRNAFLGSFPDVIYCWLCFLCVASGGAGPAGSAWARWRKGRWARLDRAKRCGRALGAESGVNWVFMVLVHVESQPQPAPRAGALPHGVLLHLQELNAPSPEHTDAAHVLVCQVKWATSASCS